MLGHLSVDMNQGALPASLPFLIAARGLTYTSATALVFASNISSSIVQPLFGYLGDKHTRYWVLSLGLVLAGSGFVMVGLLDTYAAIFIAVMISGIGNAIFHPEGGKLSNQISVNNKGSNMGIFAVGGSLAFAIGPLILSLVIPSFGMKGTSVFFIPAFAVAAIFLIQMKNLRKTAEESIDTFSLSEEIFTDTAVTADTAGPQNIESISKDDWPSFIKLSFFVFSRATVLFGMVTFIPLYWVGILNQTQAAGSVALAIYSFATVFSTVIGGFLADRYGYNKIINIGSLTFIPFLVLFTFVPDLRLSYFLLIPMGFTLQLCFSTVISIGQSFLPNHVGFASGITMGMGSSVGAIIAPVLGRVSDLYGLGNTFYILIALAVITAVTGCLVPKHRR